MEKFYSVILLVSFLVGTLQPIIPAIDYQLNQGDIFELLDSKDCDSEQSADLSDTDCTTSESDADQSLLDIDYYPLALQITTIPKFITFPYKSRLYIPLRDNVHSLNFLPNPPPPRMG